MAQLYPDRSQPEMDKLNRDSQRVYDADLKDRPQGDQAAILFNLWQKWYENLDPVDAEIDMKIGNMRIRAFGNEEKAQAAWSKEWRSKYENWGPLPSKGAVNVSADLPELWINDLRQDKNGMLVLPPHIQIHEIEHSEKILEPRLQDVHDRIRNESYGPLPPKSWW